MKYSGARQKIRHGNSQRGRFVLYSSKSSEYWHIRGIGTLYLLTDRNGFCGRYGWRFLCEVTGDGEARLSGMYILLSGQNAQSTQKQERFCTITQKSRRIPELSSNNWSADGIWFLYACGNVIKCWFNMAFYSHFSKKVLTNLQKWFIIDT